MNCIEMYHPSDPHDTSESGAIGLHGTVASSSIFAVVVPCPFFSFFLFVLCISPIVLETA